MENISKEAFILYDSWEHRKKLYRHFLSPFFVGSMMADLVWLHETKNRLLNCRLSPGAYIHLIELVSDWLQ